MCRRDPFMFDIPGIPFASRRLIMKYVLNTMKDIIAPIIHRSLNMWCIITCWRCRAVSVRLPDSFVRWSVHPLVRSSVHFNSAAHKGWLKIVFRTHMAVSSPCSHNVNRFQKRDEVAFTLCPTHFSASSLRFSKMSYQSVSDFIFRFTLAIRRCTTTRSFGCFCQLALAQYRRFALSSERITHFACIYHESLLPFTSFLLHSNSQFFCIEYHIQTDSVYI